MSCLARTFRWQRELGALADAAAHPTIRRSARALRPTILGLGLLCVAACGGSDAAGPSETLAAGSGASAAGSSSASDGETGGTPSAAAGSVSDASASPSAGGAGGAGAAGDRAAPDGLYGAFTLSLVPAREATAETEATEARTAFLGLVNDGEKPSPSVWMQEQSANGCSLYTPLVPLCDPGCGSSAACVSDDMCVPYPKSQSVGSIVLKGVGESPVEMSPVGSSNNYQPKAGTALPYPPCAEGDLVTLEVEGGAYESFELQSKCIAPLEFEGPIQLQKDTDLALTWQAPADPSLARIQVRLNISHHGGSRGEIRCDVEDNGSLTLPKAMVNRLLDLGVAGFPTIILTRIASGGVSAGQPEHVQLVVQQYVERAVEIEGLVSCNDSMLCPMGQTCQTDLTCK